MRWHRGVQLTLARSDAESLPLAAEQFDYVFSWGVLHHTEILGNALVEASRVLKPGGTGLMMIYHRNSIVYYLHGLFWLLAKGKIFGGHTLRTVQDFYTDGYFHQYLTSRELTQHLAAAGLHVTACTITQYQKKILPYIPDWLDTKLKSKFGMCLIAEFIKPPEKIE